MFVQLVYRMNNNSSRVYVCGTSLSVISAAASTDATCWEKVNTKQPRKFMSERKRSQRRRRKRQQHRDNDNDDVVTEDMTCCECCFFPAARISGEGSPIPRMHLFFSFLFYSGDQLVCINSPLHARIGPQWLSKLRRLWPSVPRQIACELVSLIYLDSKVSPLRHGWIKGVCVFRCNLPPALLAKWPGSLRATAVTRGETDTE